MTDPIKSKTFERSTGNIQINFVNKDKDKTNFEAIEIIKFDKSGKKIDTYQFTGMNLIQEECPIAGRENQKNVFAKDGSGRDNKGIPVEHNIVYMKANGFDASFDDKQIAQYINNSLGTSEGKAKDNNTKFNHISDYSPIDGTGYISEIKNPDGTTKFKYTSSLFTERKKPEAKLKTDSLIESEWPNAEFLKNK